MLVTINMAAEIESMLSALCDTVRLEGTSFEDNLIVRIAASDAKLRANKLFHILKKQSYDYTFSLRFSLVNCRNSLRRPNRRASVIKFPLIRILNLIKKANNGILPFYNWRNIINLI